MKILLLVDSFLPHAGGSRVYYYNVYERLARSCGDRITVLTKYVPGWKDFDERERRTGFDIVRRFQAVGNWKYYELHKLLLPLLTAIRTGHKLRPEVIHVGDLYPQGLIALFLKRMYGLPYIVYCHGEEVTQVDRQRLEKRMRDTIYANADGVIACSEFARENQLRIGTPANKIVKITAGVDYDRFQASEAAAALRERLRAQDSALILTVGRLVRRKGHASVIQALTRIRQIVPNVRYLIVGTGPEEANLRELTRSLELADIVSFAGYVADSDLAAYYGACDVVAMPNFEDVATGDIEGFGMVFLEANAAGKPVLAGRSGGAEEAVVEGVTGYLCNPQDIGKIAEVLERLLLRPELRGQLGENGRARVRAEFDWDSRAQAVHSLSAAVVQKSKRQVSALCTKSQA